MEIITNLDEYHYEGEDIFLEEITMKYIQAPDCTEDRDGDSQEIIISTRDGGGGKFLNIKTNGWSISGIKDLKLLINDFNTRIGNFDKNEDSDNS